MLSFLEQVLTTIYKERGSFENIVFVLPSKRSGSYLKKGISKITDKPIFTPEIYSIEEFIGKISGLETATNTQQLFDLYYTYLEQTENNQENFVDFAKWGQTLLQDFNEIDRYLIDSEKLFANLSAIQEINHWYVSAEKTDMVRNYIDFWNKLENLYNRFNFRLIQKGFGHQGLVYRKAYENLDSYTENHKNKHHVFIGFNALNTAESTIIQRILAANNADIYWDLDAYFLNDPIHDAGLFVRSHHKTWPYLKKNGLKGISTTFTQEKQIEVIGVPKSISQAKYVGTLLKQIATEQNGILKRTAVVLNDESLLNALLNSIPTELDKVNITMGFPLNKTSFESFFNQFIELYVHKQPNGWYYKNILSFLSHPYSDLLLTHNEISYARVITQTTTSQNLTFLTKNQLRSIVSSEDIPLDTLFLEPIPSPTYLVECILDLISILKSKLQALGNSLALEELFRFYGIFNQITTILKEHKFINDQKSFHTLFKELVSMETLDFKGDPIEGLQIMGMLESRNLDFETVILTSVNEGILPAGKSNNSFIPFDLKRNFGLPTFKEKDAVYTYHFYRLLQRAKNIYLIYNTEPDVLEGGERSRLITQLLTDDTLKKNITEFIAVPEIKVTPKKEIAIDKDGALLQLIKEHAAKGFSPSSLSNYVRNPLDFYKQNLLRINDLQEVEETVAANTFGTIIHDTLEDLYKPLVGKYLNKEVLVNMKGNIEKLVKHHFNKSYSSISMLRGKNLIAYNVILKYVRSFIDHEIRESEKHQIKILGLEKKMTIDVSYPEVGFPVKLTGKLDRIDKIDGILRIIDYKSGKVLPSQVAIFDWALLTEDYKYSKAFQLLCYALMYTENKPVNQLEAGIISFKNLSAGLLSFGIKESEKSRSKPNKSITQETLSQFSTELKRLILEICNPNVPFNEKEV
ncbi:PD-(D/E)XK nuclease family protein [Maribacter sp. TH_r10]|uniref:PD-(D/E)XK nuclease family protein n=1 Tax=Maribacter sp. TH_r10 TaxID=3082086 RepID=UPI0029536F42|nr:PD-(D/E)XK nuclease family protein [Maribacter sp. TH_r10]MDV7137768.1 PD-(D/E)XK nuclease family protein [Maribacter sp. TH_r10]